MQPQRRGQNSCHTEKNSYVEQFAEVILIFLGSEKPVDSCSKVKKLCLEYLKAAHSRNCHSGLEAEFICTGEGGQFSMDVSMHFVRIPCSLMLVVLRVLTILLHFKSSVGGNPRLVFERK